MIARPLRRWEFLVGKYLGVLMLMTFYALIMLGVTLVLAWLGGQQFHTSWWILLAYPFVRYALLATLLHPIFVMGLSAFSLR